MNAERLLAYYERIADAPDAVARLRRFILDLAVRGKLVPQDPRDEPASELLKRIAVEKAKQVKTGESRKPKLTGPLERIPYQLPKSWCWTRVREITSDRGQCVPKAAFTYIDVTAIEKERGIIAEPKVIEADQAPSRARKIVRKGDVVYSCVRPYLLNVAIVEEDYNPLPIASTAFAILNGYNLVLARYLWITLRSPFMVACVEEDMRGQAYPAINDADFGVLPFPLPPLAEQNRIVAKVDELLALCDRLEAARGEREARRNRFTRASLARLNTPYPDPATFAGDANFALTNLKALTARPDQIKQLRQTILNLAVRGKLVPQDPKDEPAAELLKRIARKKARLVQDGTIKASKALPPLSNADVPFAPPLLWEWSRLSEICDVQDPNPSHRMPRYVTTEGVPFISSENFSENDEINFSIGKRVSAETLKEQIERFPIFPGAIGFSRIGTIGKSRFLPSDRTYGISHAVCVINPLDQPSLSMRYLRMALSVEDILAFAHRGTRSIGVPDLGMAVIRGMAIPLPPLAEQYRIVAKVDQLMALCDMLENSLSAGVETRRRLLDALLAEALSPSEAPVRLAAE